jgi:hypothetical protein
VHLHGRPHHVVGPESRVGGRQEVGDLVCVGVPAVLRVLEGGGVPVLGRLQDLDGDGDVIVQQRGELCASRIAVKRFDRVADVDLVCNNRAAVASNPS